MTLFCLASPPLSFHSGVSSDASSNDNRLPQQLADADSAMLGGGTGMADRLALNKELLDKKTETVIIQYEE